MNVFLAPMPALTTARPVHSRRRDNDIAITDAMSCGNVALDDGVYLPGHIQVRNEVAAMAIGLPHVAERQPWSHGPSIATGRPPLAGSKVTKWVGGCEATSLPSLPRAALCAILDGTSEGKDVVAFLAALPLPTLPPEFVALRDLGAAVDLDDHWPVVRVAMIPAEHARLGIAALPAFKGVYIDPVFMTLAWLDAKLPRAMPLTLSFDPSVPGTLTTFVFNWGDRITNVIVKGHKVQPDPIPDLLGRCVNVQSMTIERAVTQLAAAACLAALPTKHLHTLKVSTFVDAPLDASAIVAWLQGPSATSLYLACVSVRDAVALASAIQTCSTLSTLSLDGVADVQSALATSAHNVHSVTSLAMRLDYSQHAISTGVLLRKLDRAKSVFLRNSSVRAIRLQAAMGALLARTRLESVTLDKWILLAVSTPDACPRLASFSLRRVQFDRAETAPTITKWLSTSRRLTSVDFSGTALGKAGVLELARALPSWMARGLQTLQLDTTDLTYDDAVLLAIALATGRNRRPLTMSVAGNEFSPASVAVLLKTLGACYDVSLCFGLTSVVSHLFTLYRQSKPHEEFHDLVRVHQLGFMAPDTFTSPPRSSSPWHAY